MRYRLILSLCCCCAVVGSVQAAQTVNRVAAIVNGDVITESDVEQMIALRGPALPTGPNRTGAFLAMRQQMLEQLIDERLLRQAMQRANVEVGDEEVSAALQTFLQERKLSLEQLQGALAARGLTVAAFRERMGSELRQMKFIQSEVAKKVSMSDEELRHFYRRNAGKLDAASKVRVAQIVIPLQGADGTADAKTQLKEARRVADLARRGDFGAVAREYSSAPEAAGGGDMGVVDPATLHPMVAAAVSRMAIGEVSAPIKSKVGYHIIKVLDRGTASDDDFTKLKPRIQEALFQQKMRGVLEQYVTELRNKAYIEIK